MSRDDVMTIRVTAEDMTRGSADQSSPNSSAEPQPQLVSSGVDDFSAVREAQHDLVFVADFVAQQLFADDVRASWQQQRPAFRRAGEHWHPAPGVIPQVEATGVAPAVSHATHSSNGRPIVVSANRNTTIPFSNREVITRGNKWGQRLCIQDIDDKV